MSDLIKESRYARQLKDPRWDGIRKERLFRAGYQCEDCGAGNTVLEVHHTFYQQGRNPWDYDVRVLVALCRDCHAKRHQSKIPVYDWGTTTPQDRLGYDFDFIPHKDRESQESRTRRWARGEPVECCGCSELVEPREEFWPFRVMPDAHTLAYYGGAPLFCPACEHMRDKIMRD